MTTYIHRPLQQFMQSGSTLSHLIHLQEELKAKQQEIDNCILGWRNEEDYGRMVRELVGEEEGVMRKVEVEASGIRKEVKDLYMRNITRYKRKINEHKQFLDMYHVPQSRSSPGALSSQNTQLLSNKHTLYQATHIQTSIGTDLHQQGTILQGGIERNRQIRREADEAQGNIDLIMKAMSKRKIMFGSLVIMLILAIGFVIIHKISKV